MTITKTRIEHEAAKQMKKFQIAAEIREKLDQARKEFGAKEWDELGLEGEIIELVTAE